MTAKVSHSESNKIQVITSQKLTGRGVKKQNTKSDGRTRYLLTLTAYEKISHLCNWEN